MPYNSQSERGRLNPSEIDLSKLNLNQEMNIELTPEMVAFLRTNLTPMFDLAANNQSKQSGYRLFSDVGVNRTLDGGSSMDYGLRATGMFENRRQHGQHNPYISMNNPLDIPVDHYVRRDSPGIVQGRNEMQESYGGMMPGRVAVGGRLPVFNDAGVGMLTGEYNRSDKPQGGGPSMDELRFIFEQAIKNGTINAYVSRMRNMPGEEGQTMNATSAGANFNMQGVGGKDSTLSIGGRYDKTSMDQKPNVNLQVLFKKLF